MSSLLIELLESFKSDVFKAVVKFMAGVAFPLVSALAVRGVRLFKYKRMLRFLGVTSKCPELTIYMSRVMVEKTAGDVGTGYTGAAGSDAELDTAIKLRDVLKEQRALILPRSSRQRLGGRLSIDPNIRISPPREERHELPKDENVISLGSYVYNSLYEEHNRRSRFFRFGRVRELREFLPNSRRDLQTNGEYRGILILGSGTQEGRILTREGNDGIRDREYGVIERVNDPETNTSRFYCAGLGTSATVGCALFLVEHWKELYEENGLDEFALYLMFPNQHSEAKKIVRPEGPDYIHRGKGPGRRWLGSARQKQLK